MAFILNYRILLRGGTDSEWSKEDPILMLREPGINTTTGGMKIGDGIRRWSQLPYVFGGEDYDLTIGSVTVGEAAASLTGKAPHQTLNLTLPQGPPGTQGRQGIQGLTGPAPNLAIGSVTTGLPGSPASVSVGGKNPDYTLAFTIPKGDTGQPGRQGDQGVKGDRGEKGDQGDTGPSTTINIGTVNTSEPGAPAAASMSGTAPNQTLNLTLPRGLKGDKGDTGPANTLAVGTITTGAAGSSAAASITGPVPNQRINLTIPKGDRGDMGVPGPPPTLTMGTVTTLPPSAEAAATLTGAGAAYTLNLSLPRGYDGSGVPGGGTTGQILRKASDTNYQVEWVTPLYANLNHTHDWGDIRNNPATYPPAAHTHPASEITGLFAPGQLPWANETNAGIIDSAVFKKIVGSTPWNVPGNMVERDSAGNAKFADPIAADDAATKKYVDTQVGSIAPANHTHAAADITSGTLALTRLPQDTAATPNTLATRDNAGRLKAADPAVSTDVATKNYVDTLTGNTSGTGASVTQQHALAAVLASPRNPAPSAPERPTSITLIPDDTFTDGVTTPYLDATSPAGVTNSTMWRREDGLAPMEFYYEGTDLQMQYTLTDANANSGLVWVDGVLAHDGYLANTDLPVNGTGYLRIKWATARRRRITIYIQSAALRQAKVNSSRTPLIPVPAAVNIGMVIDSWGGGTNYSQNYQSLVYGLMGRINGNILNSTGPGSGYVATGVLNETYGNTNRRNYLKRPGILDAVLFFGSINDPGETSTQAYRDAARATWDAYAQDHPGRPLIVYGIQPTSQDRTLSAFTHQRNRALYLEASAHPAVAGFIDMIGSAQTDTQPTPWAEATTYRNGDIASYAGAYYEVVAPGPITGADTAPVHRVNWKRLTWAMTGTGTSDTQTGDGTRDVFLGGDNSHLTAEGHNVFGALTAESLLYVLRSPSTFTYHNLTSPPAPGAAPSPGLGPVPWTNITGKPTTFTPSTHTHVIDDVTGLEDALAQATKGSDPTTSEATYTENTAATPNPGRGWYQYTETHWTDAAGSGFTALDPTALAQRRTGTETINGYTVPGRAIVFRYYVIEHMRNTDTIPAAFLTKLSEDLAAARTAGVKLIIRFTYSTDGSTGANTNGPGPYNSDTTPARTLSHVAQLKPTIAANTDVIHAVQAGFIGTWGEWFYTENWGNKGTLSTTDWTNRAQLITGLLDWGVDFVLLRYVGLKRRYLREAGIPSDAAARIGFHNDAFQASSDPGDWGTFETFADGMSVSEARAYLATETARPVPMVGETAGVSTRSTYAETAKALAEHHWSALNPNYHPDVLSSWTTTQKDEVSRRLGYRLRLVSSTLPVSGGAGSTAQVTLVIANDGYGHVLQRHPINIVFTSQAGVETRTLAFDIRTIGPGQTTITETITLPANPGSYSIGLAMPDPHPSLASRPEYAIRVSNTTAFTNGRNDLGKTILVDGAAAAITEHSKLAGLDQDDHKQYALADGSRGAFAPTNHSHAYANITGKPAAFTPETHTHAATDITSGILAPARLPAATTSAQGAMLAADKSKLDSAVSAATASRLVMRDSAGRAQFATPSATADAATKGYVDTGLAGKADSTHTHDDRYYTEAEVNALLANRPPVLILGPTDPIPAGTPDGTLVARTA